MTLLPFLAIALVAGPASLFLRREPRAAAAIGVAGLVLGLVAASTIRTGDAAVIGGVPIAGSPFIRTFLVLGCGSTLLLTIVAAAATWSRALPGASLLALAAAGIVLASGDVFIAIVAATAGATAGIVATLPPAAERTVPVAGRELRAFVAAAALALVGVAVASAMIESPAVPGSGRPLDAPLLGLAYLAVALAAAIRLGAIPFHLRAARVADAAPDVALPLVMAWSPAAFALVVIGWAHGTVGPLGQGLPAERLIVLLVGTASVVLGTFAALIHDDLEHVVAYTIVADAGVLILAVAASAAPGAGATEGWVLAFVATRTALAGWASAIRGTFGSDRLTSLTGWARRAPVLAVALLAVAVASFGLPGWAVFEARQDLIGAAVGGPLGGLLVGASLASVAVYARLLVVGLGRPASAVAAGPGWRPTRPRAARGRRADSVSDLWRANRPMAAAGATFGLALLAIAVATGGLVPPAR